MKVITTKNKAVLFGVMLSLLPVGIFNYQAGQTWAADQLAESKAGSMSDDERAIRHLAELFARAFSNGQADVIAEECAEDCTLTNAVGEKFSGRGQILKLYQRCFHDYGANPAYVTIDSIVFPAPNICLEEGSLFVPKVNTENRYSVLQVKRNGSWQKLRITESPYNPRPSEVIKDLDWLVGHWTIHAPDKTIHLKVRTIARSNFLLMSFSKDTGEADIDQLQLIGWSFKSKDIVSWHFGADGGFGFGHWQKVGPNWLINAKGVRRDGSETIATNKIERVDNDHYRWQSTNRHIGGEQLPDLPAVEVTRDK